jgi:hypothetical protein
LIRKFFLFSSEEDLIIYSSGDEEMESEEVEEKVPAWTRHLRQTYIVDVQCYQFESTPFIPKEITVSNCKDGEETLHLHIAPPVPLGYLSQPFQRQVYELSHRLHGMDWDHGKISYLALSSQLAYHLMDARYVLVKGHMKKTLLESMLPFVDVINIEVYICPSIHSIVKCYNNQDIRCGHHPHPGKHYCSKAVVTSLHSWLVENVIKQSK